MRFSHVCDVLLRVFSNLKTIILKAYIYFMSSKKKRKSPCPFASAKKPSKRKGGSNSFDKDRADVLVASDRGYYFEEEKLIALDDVEQNRWENEAAKAKTNPQNRTHKSRGKSCSVEQLLPAIARKKIS